MRCRKKRRKSWETPTFRGYIYRRRHARGGDRDERKNNIWGFSITSRVIKRPCKGETVKLLLPLLPQLMTAELAPNCQCAASLCVIFKQAIWNTLGFLRISIP